MGEHCVKEHFLDRLYGEYQAYKASVLGCPNDEIFSRCYEIEAMVNFYEIMAEKADGLSEDVLTKLLQHRNILTELYCNAALYSRRKNHFNFDSINTIMALSFRCPHTAVN